ncbi:MAG: tetratricopeptide repeat protein, partial [Thermoanaerobaculia bacterium]
NLVSLAANRWLRDRPPKGQPFFVWLHYFDPHGPKNPPEPHRSLSPDPYDAEISFADEQLGQVIRELEQQGLNESTLIVFTADHGEGLLDHGEPTHALLIFDTTVRIPLIFRIPGGAGGIEDDRLASLVDVMPSVLDLLNLETSSEQQGYSLFLPPAEQPQHRTVYMESMVGRLQHGWSTLRGLRDESHKLIYGSVPKLFRIDQDPDEVVDLSRQEPELLSEMERKLARWLEQHRSDDTVDAVAVPDQEAIRKLQSLGYLVTGGSAVEPIADKLGAEGADPHQVRHLFDLFGEAIESVRSGDVLHGISQLEEIVQEDPDNLAVLNYLAVNYNQNGQLEKARELLEHSIELDPNQEEAHYQLCRALFAAGDLLGAKGHAEAILEFQPSSIVALNELGRILASLGDEVGAIEHYELALDLDPTSLQPLMGLGVLHAKQGRHFQAGAFLQRALAVEPGNPEVLFNIGVWHLQADDRKAAIRTLSQLASISPQDRDAHFILGQLLAESGSDSRARPILKRALALNAASPDRVRQIQAYLERLR